MEATALNSARVGIIHPGPPATCGGVMAEELANQLRKAGDVEQVFVERRRKCRSISWRSQPDRVVEHWTKHFAFFQINARLPRYDIYHFLSERHATLLRYGRKPAVVTIHDAAPLRAGRIYAEGTIRRYRKNMETLLSAQAIVANTENAKRDMVELFGVEEGRVKVIYPGVNHEIYKKRNKAKTREITGLPADAKIILNVGNENKNNNMPALVEAVSLVRRRIPEAVLLRVGPRSGLGDEAIERFNAREWVVRMGADEGETTLYNYYFNAADVYLCLDYYTGYSIQGLSAMASGCPVVSTSKGGFSEIAGEDAILLKNTDGKEAASAIVSILENDRQRSELVEKGVRRSHKYKWEKTAKSYLKVYEGVLKGSQI